MDRCTCAGKRPLRAESICGNGKPRSRALIAEGGSWGGPEIVSDSGSLTINPVKAGGAETSLGAARSSVRHVNTISPGWWKAPIIVSGLWEANRPSGWPSKPPPASSANLPNSGLWRPARQILLRFLPGNLHSIAVQNSRRRLPHRYPPGKWLFLTWHLHGSLPQARYPPAHKLSAGRAFVWMDRYLDTTRDGPMYLHRQEVAQIVVESLKRGVELGHYDLRAYVVMANHVHVLLLPKVAPGADRR